MRTFHSSDFDSGNAVRFRKLLPDFTDAELKSLWSARWTWLTARTSQGEAHPSKRNNAGQYLDPLLRAIDEHTVGKEASLRVKATEAAVLNISRKLDLIEGHLRGLPDDRAAILGLVGRLIESQHQSDIRTLLESIIERIEERE